MARQGAGTPELGGGGHSIFAGIQGNGSASIIPDAGWKDRGREVLELIDIQVRSLPGTEAVRELGRLAKDFPEIVLRAPAFHDAVRFLRRKGPKGAVARVFGDARLGRPFSRPFFTVMLMKQVMADENLSAARAAIELKKRYPEHFGMKTARSIEREYSTHHRAYELWNGGTFVDGSQLTRLPLRPPAESRSP